MFQVEVVEKNEIHVLCSVHFFKAQRWDKEAKVIIR
jgi:hypothetical protein